MSASTPIQPPRRAIVFCERLDNESFCQSVVDALEASGVEVRACGPGWPDAPRLADVDPTGATFYLELDAASGKFVRPDLLALSRLRDVPKLAWLVDTHKKIEFHRGISRDVDLTLFAMKTWGHVFDRPAAWLPLHADPRYFHPVDVPDAERRWDVVFVGSQTWRADPIVRLAAKHGLSVHVTTTTGPREKSDTAAIYAQARVVFNRHVTNDLNFRTFEATACGRALLTDAQNNGQYELFEDGRHLVLYKDETDLEHQLLRLLRDPGARAALERAAAEHAQAQHTTCARVARLLQHVDALLASRTEPGRAATPTTGSITTADASALVPREAPVIVRSLTPATDRDATPHARPPRAPEPAPRRWLVLSPHDAPTADLQSYTERLARCLARRGHDVVLARAGSRCAARDRRAPGLRVVDLDAGPLPVATSPENCMLAAAGPLHRHLDRLASEYGPFDAIVAEGPFGQLAGPPLARRLDLPLLLALSSCEVLRRHNHLTRDQLYTAELEHWAVDRADLVLSPWTDVADAVRQHYRAPHVEPVPCPPPNHRSTPLEARRLAQRLGIDGPFALALGLPPTQRDQRAIVWSHHGATTLAGRTLTKRSLTGPALSALLLLADGVLVTPCDPARADACAVADRVAVVSDATDVDAALRAASTRPLAGESAGATARERRGGARRSAAPARPPGAAPPRGPWRVSPRARRRSSGWCALAGPPRRRARGRRKRLSYSDTLLQHFWQPKNHRVMKDADRVGVAGVPGNGPFMVLYLRLDGETIAEAAFQTHGCPPSIAVGSLLTTNLPGRRLDETTVWTEDALSEALGGLPPHKRHCSALGAEALRRAVSITQQQEA